MGDKTYSKHALPYIAARPNPGNNLEVLENWFQSNGGNLNPSLELAYSKTSGQHFVAAHTIPASEDSTALLCKCPFKLTLSFLSVKAPPPAGIRDCSAESICSHLVDKIPTASLSYFFLCEQRLLGEKSFWAPYIVCLPKEDAMTTPWWFGEDDLVWLLGTNIHLSSEPEKSGIEMRKRMWKQQWEEGVDLLRAAGIHTEAYTWELFLWAATIFSSRSFTSLIITPSTSETSAKESFALLYPVLDTFNHKFGAKVLWNMDKGDFQLSTTEPANAGEEVYNNYAPKGNEELLNGYGFCIEDNPCDEVAIRIGKPPEPVHVLLREQYPARFRSSEWTDADATFYLRSSDHYSGGYQHSEPLFRGLPPELIGTLRAILDYSYKQAGSELEEEHLEPAAVDAILERLIAKYQGIRQWDGQLTEEPQNDRQMVAKLYRDGQLAIMEEIIGELQEYLEQF